MKKLSLIIIFFLSSIFIFPCGWDWDTIQMEKQEFPTVHELITGKFLRHSPELYYWRIMNRTALLKKHPDSLHYYDDLAMAYDKTGDSKKAIETMLKKDEWKKDQYETWANLGLFYMHNGEMQKGVDAVKKALKINPNAHFGRERYQLYLGEYILSRTKDGTVQLPLAQKGQSNFYDFLYEKYMKGKISAGSKKEKELSLAIKGVSGMMTFANYKSPVLLEALADLLMKTNSVGGAGHLGSRAYLKASFEIGDEKIKKAYYDKASVSREYSYGPERIYNRENKDSATYMMNPDKGNVLYRMDQLEIALKLEVQSAEIWYDSIRMNELKWLKEKKNPDSMFAITYYKDPKSTRVVSEYETKKREGEIDEEYWMRNQLEAPDFIRNIHGYAALPDSVKKQLDEIYGEELGSKNVIAKKNGKNEKSESQASENSSLTLWIILGSVFFVVGVWYFVIIRRKSNK
jgi:tetratricopeptide (TPR) repeat protein